MPIIDRVDEKALGIEISDGHLRLVMNNLDEAAQSIVPQLTQRRPNGKIALCGSLDCPSRVHVNAMARILEIEGWEVFNLGDDVTFELLAQMVKDEPVDLVCVSSIDLGESNGLFESFQTLFEATHPYRIPVLMAGKDLASPRLRRLYSEARFVKSFRKVRRHAVKLGRV